MDNEPPQDKICYSGRFLDSHSFARNDMSGGGSVLSARVLFATSPGTAHRPFPTVSLGGSTSAPIVPTMQNVVPRLIHRLRRSSFPEGEGSGAGLRDFLNSPWFGRLTDCKIPETVYDVSVFPHQRYLILRSISGVIFAIVRQFYEMDFVFIRIVRNDRPVLEVLTFVAM